MYQNVKKIVPKAFQCQADLMVMARTYAIAAKGYEEGLRRGLLYAENDAELIFIEPLLKNQQLRDAAAAFKDSRVLLVANMIEGSLPSVGRCNQSNKRKSL